MKIVLTTDFTEKSDFAIDQTLMLFKGFEAKFYLMHAFKSLVPYTNKPAIPVMHNEELEKELRKKFDNSLEILKQKVDVEGIFRRGTITEVADQVFNEIGPDLMVAGIQEGTAFERQTFGSNAEDLIDYVQIPLLLIPFGRQINLLGNFGLVTDLNNSLTKSSVSILYTFSDLLEEELIISNIYHEETEEEALAKMESSNLHTSLDGLTHQHKPFFCNDIYEGILRFVKDYDINLLAVIPHERSFFKDLFHQSITKKLNLNAVSPLLILQEEKS